MLWSSSLPHLQWKSKLCCRNHDFTHFTRCSFQSLNSLDMNMQASFCETWEAMTCYYVKQQQQAFHHPKTSGPGARWRVTNCWKWSRKLGHNTLWSSRFVEILQMEKNKNQKDLCARSQSKLFFLWTACRARLQNYGGWFSWGPWLVL
jgi:hypothetical protein